MKSNLPNRVNEKDGSYYYVVRTDDGKRKWQRLSRIKEGLPAMYAALANLNALDMRDDCMARVIGEWTAQVGATHTKKTRENDTYMNREIGKSFAQFRACEVTPPDVMKFLKAYTHMPRSYNAYRGQIRELMRFAEQEGWRESGSNPTQSVRTMSNPARNRYITDSELRRVKVAAIYYYRKPNARSESATVIKKPPKIKPSDLNFESVSRKLFEQSSPAWSERYRNWWITRMENYIFPLLGSLAIGEVTTQSLPDVLTRCNDAQVPANVVTNIHRMTVRSDARTRSMLIQVLRYASAQGLIELAIAAPPIKTRVRSGMTLVALIDMAYLTGQRVGDLLGMQWSEILPKGILFQPDKTLNSTGVKVLIEWTPKLTRLVERLKELKQVNITPWVFTNVHGQKLSYEAVKSSWRRARIRAGVDDILDIHFHDIRAKALTDVDDLRGVGEAQTMGGHATQTQTADYIRHKKAKQTLATR